LKDVKISELFDLTGRIALVTGSSAGIGFALALGLGKAGASIILNGRRSENVALAAERLRDEGISSFEMPFDVTDGNAVKSSIAEIEDTIGPIDILINNAGMQRRGSLEDYPEADWNMLMKANVDSVFYVGQSVAKRMIPRGRGKIINICSVQSELGRPSIAPYAATKGAVKMLTKGMAIDWGRYGLQVNGIGPGYFKTELNQALVEDKTFSDWLIARTPSRRWGELEDLIGIAVFLASDASNFVNGQIIYVDGGVTASL
jgi:gluconate 5-dehydrogenase